MTEESAERFKIVSYSEESGASYYSDNQMNPQLFAWAEFDVRIVQIKIVNNTSNKVLFNYNLDQFIIEAMDDKKYILTKGKRQDYPGQKYIQPGENVQFNLAIPQNFWQTVGLSDADASNPDYLTDFWQGENSLNLIKESIKQIRINLAGQTMIILKPVPDKG